MVNLKHSIIWSFLIALCTFKFTLGITLFDKSKSYAIFDVWDITKAGKLELKFKTQSIYCMVLYVDSKKLSNSDSETKSWSTDTDDNKSFLEVALIQGRIEITHQILSRQYKKTLSIGENLNDLEWHTLRITKFVGTLQIEVDKSLKILNFPNNVAERFRIQSRLYIGGLSKNKQMLSFGGSKYMPRFFGCIEDLRYSSGSMETKPALRVLKGESVAAKCLDTCGINPCKNNGKCVNLFTRAACDCFGTGYGGDRCTKPSETIHLEEKDHIRWSLQDTSSYRERLSFNFRLKTAKPDGVIFYTKRGGNILSVELVGGKLRVSGGKSTDIPKGIYLEPNLFDGEWHTIEISRSEKSIKTKIDNSHRKNLTVQTSSNKNAKLAEPVFIGGVDSKYTFGVISSNNFVGCLQQILYNKIDVIYKLKRTISDKIQKVGRIQNGCGYNKTNIDIPTKIPVTTDKNDEDDFEKKVPVIKEIHTREGGMGQNVIIWITAAIVIGTIIILISAACVVHHVRRRYYQMKVQQKKQQQQLEHEDSKESLAGDENDDDSTPMKEIEPDDKSNDSSSRAGTPTINNLITRQCKEDDEHVYILDTEGEVSEV